MQENNIFILNLDGDVHPDLLSYLKDKNYKITYINSINDVSLKDLDVKIIRYLNIEDFKTSKLELITNRKTPLNITTIVNMDNIQNVNNFANYLGYNNFAMVLKQSKTYKSPKGLTRYINSNDKEISKSKSEIEIDKTPKLFLTDSFLEFIKNNINYNINIEILKNRFYNHLAFKNKTNNTRYEEYIALFNTNNRVLATVSFNKNVLNNFKLNL